MDELTLGDKTYISSKRAAAITGYAKDYVGQLCREGQVEAKMVGRSWYVLESSIRKHRFGETHKDEMPRGEEARPHGSSEADLPETWEASKYVTEEVPEIPNLIPQAPPPVARETTQSLDMSPDRQSLSEMQTAWKEWFESKHEPLLESPEVMEAREEAREEAEDAVPIVVHKIPEIRPVMPEQRQTQAVRIASIQPAPQARVSFNMGKVGKTRPARRTNLILLASLIVVAGLSIAVGVVGAGFADTYLDNNVIIKYLGGTRTIEKP